MLNDVKCRCTCPGVTVWVTGRSVGDRRAAACAMAERLAAEGRRVKVLDRLDEAGADAGRVGMVAEVLARNGVVAIVPSAAAGAVTVRARHEASRTRYMEIGVAAHEDPQVTAARVAELLTGPRLVSA
ncbi:hypothetical protein [Streptomyces sp. S.PB5]|uniref:hypothetical protein n=1 Tax=Streptomyces sp. S.PB5 TaxID=3020844 RepID=UPI0025B025A6|nr:hypothetical protein [Streptomyces sp. S.PB5]MDN3027232.1 hypothetical protein [Streptomyces sp. S.PB5]